jgi:hypothetical protein
MADTLTAPAPRPAPQAVPVRELCPVAPGDVHEGPVETLCLGEAR